jgi:hypothetical protein
MFEFLRSQLVIQEMTGAPNGVATADRPWLEVLASRHFAEWLAEQNVSLALTTYQAGKLFLIGRQHSGHISVFERTFNRCMGLWVDGPTIWMSSLYQLWRLENGLKPGNLHDGHDALYIPRIGYTTGDIDLHDLAVEQDGRVLFGRQRDIRDSLKVPHPHRLSKLEETLARASHFAYLYAYHSKSHYETARCASPDAGASGRHCGRMPCCSIPRRAPVPHPPRANKGDRPSMFGVDPGCLAPVTAPTWSISRIGRCCQPPIIRSTT